MRPLLLALTVPTLAAAQPPILYRETVREYAAPPPPPAAYRLVPVVRETPVVYEVPVVRRVYFADPAPPVYAAPVYLPAAPTAVEYRYGPLGRLRSVRYR